MVYKWVKLTFVKTQKTIKKTQKEERENTKNNLYSLNSEKAIKTIFLLLSKKWFLRIQKTQKTKTRPLPQTSFLCFFVFKNRKQF